MDRIPGTLKKPYDQAVAKLKWLKIVGVGSCGAGKTSLIKHFCESKFTPSYLPTVGADYGFKVEIVNGSEFRINIWDLSGNSDYFDVRNELYLKTDGVFLVFDVTNTSSFESLDQWLREIAQYSSGSPKIFIIGNKTDLKHKRTVNQNDAMKLSQSYKCQYFETSAATGDGWQPRWFVLDNGVLSYYKSQEDVNNGCKGSIKMAVCDIVVHPMDMTRLDLIIPGEQHYYVKAGTPQDRQSWLIALGSSKASFNQVSGAKKETDDVPDQVRTKKSELRLYCDLLMQQVHSVKEAVSGTSGQVDFEKLKESASLIGETCDTFISTLDECMKIVSNTPMFESPHQHVLDAAIPSSPTRPNAQRLPENFYFQIFSSGKGTRSTISRPLDRALKNRSAGIISSEVVKIHTSSSHQSLHDSPIPHHPTSPLPAVAPYLHLHPSMEPGDQTPMSPVGPSGSDSLPVTPASTNGLTPEHHTNNSNSWGEKFPELTHIALSNATSSDDLETMDDFKDAIDETIPTFFSAMPLSFSNVDTSDEDSILVIPFLDACINLVPIFDKLNSTAFSPVKMDFSGNIKKIQQKHQSDKEKFVTLQAMILEEVQNGQQTHSNSATSALLWLKRSLEFIREFLRECCSGSTDMDVCASNAYSRTLKNYHGWVVRGVFAVAVKALPYRETFISHLTVDSNTDPTTQQFEHALLSDIEIFVQHLDRVLVAINNFYQRHSLDSPDKV